MALDIDDLLADTATITFKHGEQSSQITYRPNLITVEKIQSMNVNIGSVDDAQPLFDFLSDLIVEWEFTKGGQPLPTTQEGIKAVPLPVLTSIMNLVVEAQTPGEVERLSVAS